MIFHDHNLFDLRPIVLDPAGRPFPTVRIVFSQVEIAEADDGLKSAEVIAVDGKPIAAPARIGMNGAP